jgi:hypothetical protein
MDIEIVHGFVDHEAGDIVKVETVAPGVPKDIYWRRRLKDAAIDGCVKLPKKAKKNRKAVDVPVADEGIE